MPQVSNWYKELSRRLLIRNTAEMDIIEREINDFMTSDKLKEYTTAEMYYQNKTDIQNKQVDMDWKHNARIELGLYRKLTKQKVGYLLSLPPTISTEDERTTEFLNDEIFDRNTLHAIKSLGTEAIKKGIAYSLVYYDEEGKLCLFKLPTEQVIPLWSDERRTKMDAFIRFYTTHVWEAGNKVERIDVEYWTERGTEYFISDGGKLKPNPEYDGIQPHFYYFDQTTNQTQGMNWERLPIIAWRYNEDETSLLTQVKSLIDNLSTQVSVNADLLADLPNNIYVLKDYGGESLDQFLHHLNKYLSIKVNGDGDVSTLSAQPNTTGAEAEINRTRKSLYEAGSGIDTQDENLGNASGLALKWRYTDLDLDMNDMEAEFQHSIEQFMWFVEQYAKNNGKPDNFTSFSYIFNRDVIVNETEVIQNALNSVGILDDQTIRENHPWYKQVVEDRLDKQQSDRHRRANQLEDYADHNRGDKDGQE